MIKMKKTTTQNTKPKSQFHSSMMTSPQFKQAVKKSPVVVIPAGSHEQHGSHLPLGTDSLIACSIAEKAVEKIASKIPVIITPPIPFGCSAEHLDFPGTLSLKPDTFMNIMRDLIESLALSGVKKILVVNGHGGNIHPLGTLLHETARKYDMFLAFTFPTSLTREALKQVRSSKDMGGFHAGEPETSMILQLAPQLVNKNNIQKPTLKKYHKDTKYIRLWDSKFLKGFSWTTKEISPSGVIGDPTTATEKKGKILLDAAIDNLAKLIQEIYTKTID